MGTKNVDHGVEGHVQMRHVVWESGNVVLRSTSADRDAGLYNK